MRALALILFALVGLASVAAVAVASGGSLPITTAVPTGEDSTANVTDEQARDTDAREYAADFGVSLAEAIPRPVRRRLDRARSGVPGRGALQGAVPPEAADVAGANVALRGGAIRSFAELQGRADTVFADVSSGWDTTLATTFDVKTGTSSSRSRPRPS